MRLRFQLLVFMGLRTVLNTLHRMVYPFLAVFARGLGVDIAMLSFVVTLRSFVGMFRRENRPIPKLAHWL